MMADDSRQTDAKTPPRIDVLRAKDVIPGSPDRRAEDTDIDVPRFDLGEQAVSQHRQAAAVKRKAPGTGAEPKASPRAEPQQAKQRQTALPRAPQYDPIIAEIVARDIERLCRGQ